MNPHAKHYNPSPEYLRCLVAKSGLSQREIGRRLDVPFTTLRDWLNSNHPSQANYCFQYTLERLSA